MIADPTKRNAFLLAALILSLVVAGPAQAQCLGNSILGIFYMDLRFGATVDVTGGAVTVLTAPENNPDCTDGSKMAVVRIDIPEACSQANVLVEYEGQPEGWTVNLGDSPSNDGFGGDAGDTDADAELQILDDILAVYNASGSDNTVDRLASLDLRLNEGAIRLTVGDQTVGWGQPYGVLETPDLGRLFSIPDPEEEGEGRSIYLGVNRTIADADRKGCGARRVLISFQ